MGIFNIVKPYNSVVHSVRYKGLMNDNYELRICLVYREVTLPKNGLEINLPAFLSEYSNVYCHITCVLDVWQIYDEGINW